MAISFDRSTKTFYLDGRSITYAFTVNSYGYAEHLYFGKKIPHDPLFFTRGGGMGDHEPLPPEVRRGYASYDMMWTECSFHGTGDYREPCVLVENAAGDRLSDLLFAGYEILSEKPRIPGMPSSRGGETLVLHLADKFTAFSADLYYTVWEDEDVIARRAVYRNGADTPAKLRRAYSFSLSLPGQEYDAISFYGGWARERTPERTPIGHHVYAIDSKRCSSSASLNPFLVIAGRHTDEDRGEEVFEPCDATWRGLGVIPGSGYALRDEYAEFDALKRFSPTVEPTVEPAGCQCGDVLRGVIYPNQCKLFARVCTPEHPVGPCMVSSEGSCAAYYRYTEHE